MDEFKKKPGLIEGLLPSQPKRLWRRYVVAIGIIISLLVGSHVAHITTLNEAAKDASVINASGKQRMLSQRILFLATNLSDTNGPQDEQLLKDTIDQFENAHELLLEYVSDSAEIERLYVVGQDDGLDNSTKQFISLARMSIGEDTEDQETLNDLKELGTFDLLRDLDRAVTLFEMESEKRAQNLKKLQEATLALALFTIIVEGILIFWPAQLSINRAISGLKKQNLEIREANKELSDLASKMTHAACHDPLTGVPNRKKLEDELSNRFNHNNRSSNSLCLMHVDLDHFKEVNDTLGHLVGDEVIRQCAKIMSLTIRDEDLVARVGGDEFVLVLDLPIDGREQKASEIAQSLIKRISAPMEISGKSIAVGASVGIAFRAKNDTSTSLIGNADIALYQAKSLGRGTSCIFSREMRKEMELRHSLSQDLREAVQRGQFVPYFQPQVHFADGSLAGFESLARWHHPLRGMLAPAEFMDLARELAIIREVDLQILTKSLEQLADLRRSGWVIPKISVNFDVMTLRLPRLTEWLEAELNSRDLVARDLVIEVTEAALIEGEDDVAFRTLVSLKNLGTCIHLDDFGTGYSSLSYLAMLDLDGIKIDRSLISDPTDKKARQVILAITGIAEGLDLDIIAEGIEDPKQFSALKEMNCHIAQGFGIGHPLAENQVEKWLGSYGKSDQLIAKGTI